MLFIMASFFLSGFVQVFLVFTKFLRYENVNLDAVKDKELIEN